MHVKCSRLCEFPELYDEILKFTQKWKYCHHLLSLELFWTCMNFFVHLNLKEDILKNVHNQKVSGPHWLQ